MTRWTPQQVAWARSHDWFHKYEDGRLWVVNSYTFAGKSYSDLIEWQESFRKLKEWAGY